ncbi:CDP-glycerol glycerophosphotransferase family protein [Peribacillus sp. Hz7]|uniref:CDP-glycerol glycerophosphotransferase family protein n=1 Tax=Peribacillus sp. Hz7 TaxID=3344873 RepID=UPI0035C9D9CC
MKISEIPSSANFHFDVNLNEFKDVIVEPSYGLYILMHTPEEELTVHQYNAIKDQAKVIVREDGKVELEYFIRLGKFDEISYHDLLPFELNQKKSILYLNTNQMFTLLVDKEITCKPEAKIKFLKAKKDHFLVKGEVRTKSFTVKESSIVLSGRETGIKIKVPVRLHEEMSNGGERNYYYSFQTNIPLHDIKEVDIYDLFMDLELKNDMYESEVIERSVRLGMPKDKAKKYTTKPAYINHGEFTHIATPYFTIKYFNISIQIDKFDTEISKYLTKMMRFAWLLKPFYKKQDIWIVGERPYKAQDTGYRFFKYMRTQHPDRNTYYVIDEDSPEKRNVQELGNVLHFGSKKHILYTLVATRVIGSHHPDYLYPLRTEQFKKKVKAKKVFLQHGVMGTKNTVHFYGEQSPSFETDLFIVSSDYEKSIIVQDFGYSKEQVKVTGLSRFDSLFLDDIKTKREILIIPTWREWIVNDEIFLESEYFERYKELVFSPVLQNMADKYNFDIVLCLHPNMQRFTSYFNDANIRIVTQGEVDVQDLMKESALMITDYSSVAFDFSFLDKPVLYYQFDRRRFIGKKPSHLDLDNDLPGDIIYQLEDILALVEHYASNDFKMKDEFKKRAKKFLKYKDGKSGERIYNATREIRSKKKFSFKKLVVNNQYVKKTYKKFRKSKIYFPIMKKVFTLFKWIFPVSNNVIVFESGIGKQYSDSPKYIYEEILKRKLKYKKVWIYNKKARFRDPNTIAVRRFSIKYYYYLATAKYWVNNQNFPTYIKKRKETTYIQTWHGTPLKRMLFDIENVQGRTDDYVERVYGATKTWSYLISPSEYASNCFRSAFKYEGNILEVGYPRNDLFFRADINEISSKVKGQLKLPTDKKVILYAPTFRDNETNGNNKFQFNLMMDLESLKERFGEEYVILLRMHVVISSKLKIPEEYRGFVYNVSGYSDIQELYLISDILITDYSSVMFDFANTSKPILFFTYDLDLYKNDIRGFYMDFEKEAPGPLLFDTNDIIEAVTNIDEVNKQYKEKYSAFKKKYCSLEDGKAAERIVDQFFS